MEGKIAERVGRLWIPDDSLDLLSLWVDGDCSDEEIDNSVIINQASRNWLDGELGIIEYLDTLEHYGVPNPFELVDEFVEHIELVL